ncbi:DEAD/DEAH box helicase family protein [Chryseobacterium polytrichastri]|uniref:Helicase conserved C-terminal domain-containing protein n=1 Tax=Chryseobacterium polytrichastri TaxID=1302687 RepID=A0A1M7GZ38_9FLAO|nr:DEAD/DEAH box helicase family protein [Chryseobacterium polytrichastri]SHM21652.1 Helicase conserved C-terminal domain-containing protein [Chryseobacterium polytrichastri]
MNSFPENLKFKYNWRKYQKNFLDNVDEYLTDNHLHIVAPPGSGKTVLGLEVMIRLNKPTLIVAPTLAIRNQWIQRFGELFLNTEIIPDWISTDIKNPGFITVTTYQGIHAACNTIKDNINEEADEISSHYTISELVKKLKKQKVGTFILDEAHHLKNVWWRSLIDLKAEINPTIVALTATPPFDVSGAEWQKYIQLNGAVDVEISVPELMIEGDLCPHQDLVYFTLPTQKEQLKIEQYHIQANEFFEEIRNDDVLLGTIENHSVYQDPQLHLEWIYENVSSYTSGLVYMNFRGKEISELHFEIIGDEQKFIPEFDFFWFEELLDFYLFVDGINFKDSEEYRTDLENRLRRHGFLDKKRVGFFDNKNVSQILNSSIGKLQGIKDIADFEYSVLKEDLKMVILTDFIKKEYLSTERENTFDLDKMGAISIFEKLRRENSQQKKVGVLTGSIVIIPKTSLGLFNDLCLKKGISKVSVSELSYDGEYFLVNLSESVKHDIVHIVTEIFQSGEIQILIGTKSLLGEGWDAPKMNTLILASFVSSFVLSNQMRGRVIRTQKDNPEKTGNIWHLICFDEHSENGGQDFDIVRKRFKTFVGISSKDNPTIENNFERLHIKTIENNRGISLINQNTFVSAGDRKNLSKRWKIALDKGDILVEEIQIPFEELKDNEKIKMKSLGKMITNLSGAAVSAFVMFWWDLLMGMFRSAKSISSVTSFSWFAFLFGAAGFLIYGGKFYRATKQYLKYRNIAKHIELIGNIVVKGLINERIIRTPLEKLKVVSSADHYKNTVCHLEGGSNYEKSQFIQTLQELVSPVDNPRYLLEKKESFLFVKKNSYYPLPEVFAKNKRSAEFFSKTWSEMMEASDLIFTRTIEGRKILLTLRFQSLMKRNVRIEHLHKWTR